MGESPSAAPHLVQNELDASEGDDMTSSRHAKVGTFVVHPLVRTAWPAQANVAHHRNRLVGGLIRRAEWSQPCRQTLLQGEDHILMLSNFSLAALISFHLCIGGLSRLLRGWMTHALETLARSQARPPEGCKEPCNAICFHRHISPAQVLLLPICSPPVFQPDSANAIQDHGQKYM